MQDTDTSLDGSCHLQWKNNLFVYGGSPSYNQVRKLIGKTLSSVGKLPFTIRGPACCNMNDQKIFLCENRKMLSPLFCYTSTSASFDSEVPKIKPSAYYHASASVAASESKYKQKINICIEKIRNLSQSSKIEKNFSTRNQLH